MLEQPGLKHRSRQMKLRRTFLTFTSFSFIFNVNTTLLLSYLWNCQLAFWAVCCIIEKHADEEDFFLSCICCLSKNIYKIQPQMYKSTHNFFLYTCLSVFIRNCGMLNFSLSGWYRAKTFQISTLIFPSNWHDITLCYTFHLAEENTLRVSLFYSAVYLSQTIWGARGTK